MPALVKKVPYSLCVASQLLFWIGYVVPEVFARGSGDLHGYLGLKGFSLFPR